MLVRCCGWGVPNLVRVLDEAPAVHVAHVGFVALRSEEVEAAHLLSESQRHQTRDLFLLLIIRV